MKILPIIYDNLFPLNNFPTIKEYFEYFMFDKNIADLDTPLYESVKRKQWIEDYPNLECFPETLNYIKDEKLANLNKVHQELSNIKLYLPVNQILFHSGNLPNGVPLKIGEKFQLKEIFSTTIDPYIANVHDSEDDVYWYIQVKDNIRCLPIPDEYGEYEVIILDSPIAEIVDIKVDTVSATWSDMNYSQSITKTIVYIDIYKNNP